MNQVDSWSGAIRIAGRLIEFDPTTGIDLSIPLVFGGPQPVLFNGTPATSIPFRGTSFVGSVQHGGSCNVATLAMTPHLNGTHTECVGHITPEPVWLLDIIPSGLIPATVVTVVPELAGATEDRYVPEPNKSDVLVTRSVLAEPLRHLVPGFSHGLVLRTLPNDPSKRNRNYDVLGAPFLSLDAVQLLTETGVEHLVLDLPSIDRMNDGGRMSAHRSFWSGVGGEQPEMKRSARTITELAYIPPHVSDGIYLMSIQVPPFASDAAPSRPVLYPTRRSRQPAS